MLKQTTADQIFARVKRHLPTPKRRLAAPIFRRAIRQYFVYSCRRFYVPWTWQARAKLVVGEKIVFTGGRRRRIKVHQRSPGSANGPGRPPNAALDFLVARLSWLWLRCHGKPSSMRHKGNQFDPTSYELFVSEVFAELGYFNWRRYIEKHSQQRARPKAATNF